MTEWIHSYQSLRSHPKTRKFARTVGGLPAAIGHLHCLWWWSTDYAKDGDLTQFTVEEIAEAAEWKGDADEFVQALVLVGFLDSYEDGSLLIHDHHEYIGRFLDKMAADAARKRSQREVERGGKVVPRGRPKRVGEKPLVKPDEEKVYPADFLEFWEAYPHKAGKDVAAGRWGKLSEQQRIEATEVARAMSYCVSVGFRDRDKTPMGSTFLNQHRWNDWYNEDGELRAPPGYGPADNGKKRANDAAIVAAARRAFSGEG